MSNGDASVDGIRVWHDGCYDLLHFGHANSLRQAKEMGSYLIAGVASDEDIFMAKGPTVYTQEERMKMVRSCYCRKTEVINEPEQVGAIKWVDQVVEAPYLASVDVLNHYRCAFCVHGDDISTLPDGRDSFHIVKAAGRYRECQRTAGISTTELIARILSTTHNNNMITTRFLPTTRMIQQFSGVKARRHRDKIVYTAGTFDLCHAGHVDFLRAAAAEGDYLIVGLHSDEDVKRFKGSRPIMSVNERTMNVLAYRYVNEVCIGAPYRIDEQLLDYLRVDVVVRGSSSSLTTTTTSIVLPDPYKEAKRRGCLRTVDSGNSLTTDEIVRRVVGNRECYVERNERKSRSF